MAPDIVRVGDTIDLLGEGLLWDAEHALLYWVDSIGQLIRWRDLATGEHREMPAPSEIGMIALRAGGGLIAALRDGLYLVDPVAGTAALANRIDTGRTDQRFNDGKVDRQGRLVVGTMHAKAPADRRYFGRLYSIGHDLREIVLEENIGCANGPCFSPDGRTLYFTDSHQRKIWKYDYDAATGAIADKRVILDTEAYGSPADGQTVDAEGFVWTTLTAARKILCLDPDGRVALDLDVPFQPTNVAFGGSDLTTLFVTSLNRTPNVQATGPGAGWLYAIEGLPARGLPEPRFLG
jgi:sugar lactone lactonase YvrE